MASADASSAARLRRMDLWRRTAAWMARQARKVLGLSAGLSAEASSTEAQRMIEAIGRGHAPGENTDAAGPNPGRSGPRT